MLILRVENLEPAQTHGQRGRWVVVVELPLAHFLDSLASSSPVGAGCREPVPAATTLIVSRAQRQAMPPDHQSDSIDDGRVWMTLRLAQRVGSRQTRDLPPLASDGVLSLLAMEVGKGWTPSACTNIRALIREMNNDNPTFGTDSGSPTS